jgi:hypothetical protein
MVMWIKLVESQGTSCLQVHHDLVQSVWHVHEFNFSYNESRPWCQIRYREKYHLIYCDPIVTNSNHLVTRMPMALINLGIVTFDSHHITTLHNANEIIIKERIFVIILFRTRIVICYL